MPRRDDESGSSLVLALVFLVAISLIIGGLTAWTSNDLSNSLSFQNSRNADYALNSATQVAIQDIRYNTMLGENETLDASPPANCWTTASGPSQVPEADGYTVDVWCSTEWNPTSSATRIVTVSACLDNASMTASVCETNPGLRTVVTFDDYSSADPVINQGGPCNPCGVGMTVDGSSPSTTTPTVTALSASSANVNATTNVTVTGTGFISGSTAVSLVSNSVPNLTIDVASSAVSVTSPTSLTFSAPPVTTAGSYYVVVSTADGVSPHPSPDTADLFTYHALDDAQHLQYQQ